MPRGTILFVLVFVSLAVTGCPKAPKAKTEYQKGLDAQAAGDLDEALRYFQEAFKSEPSNASYKVSLEQSRFEASQKHVQQGIRLREQGQMEAAAHEFELALTQSSSNTIAVQELEKTRLKMSAERESAATRPATNGPKPLPWATLPPELKPMSRAPINLRMTNDARVVFETIGKLSGLSVIFDPDFTVRRVSVELTNVTLEQALDIACLESKTFWKPVTENIVMVIPDQTQKRRDFDEQIMRTFYMSNTVQAQDLTEIVTGLRQLLDLKRIQQLNGQNAIVIRDTPSKIALAEKFIDDIDRAKPEVVIEVEVLQASTDKLRTLGISPGQSASITVNPNSTSSSSSSTTVTSTLEQLGHLNGSDYSVTLPSFTANAVLTDSNTRIIQNPEIRIVDGMIAHLKVGDRVPVATGSYSAGTSVTTASSLSSLVSTQFQYIDVGVNLDVTPRIHPDNEISLKVAVEVSSVTSYVTIGSIQQPVISQRKVEHDIRLKEGEANILGGLFQRTDTKSLNGWPGVANIPILRYLFSTDNKETQESDVLIILTPHIVRNIQWSQDNLKSVVTGTDTNVEVHREIAAQAPQGAETAGEDLSKNLSPSKGITNQNSATQRSAGDGTQKPEYGGQLKVAPTSSSMKVGETRTFSVAVDGVTDLFSIPLLIKYDPAVIRLEDVQNGGFLSGEAQELAIVQRNDSERGEAVISAVRRPRSSGVNGSGILFNLTVKAVAPGTSQITIVQVNAKNSSQKTIPLVTLEATVQIHP
jgi:general secretion pathway protein D